MGPDGEPAFRPSVPDARLRVRRVRYAASLRDSNVIELDTAAAFTKPQRLPFGNADLIGDPVAHADSVARADSIARASGAKVI